MKKYCQFLKDVSYKGEVIWYKDEEHLVTYEDSEVYCFGEPMVSGISKEYENNLFKVIEKKN